MFSGDEPNEYLIRVRNRINKILKIDKKAVLNLFASYLWPCFPWNPLAQAQAEMIWGDQRNQYLQGEESH